MKRLRTKQLIFFSYFFSVFILNRLGSFSFSFFFIRNTVLSLVSWLFGAILGGYFIKLDQLIYIYFTNPEEPLSIEIKSLLKQKNKKQAWILLRQMVGKQKLTFRSFLFQISWVILAFFTLTSTNVIFGRTMVMAIGLHILLDEWEAILSRQSISWLFWQIKRPISFKEQRWFVGIISTLFLFLTLLMI